MPIAELVEQLFSGATLPGSTTPSGARVCYILLNRHALLAPYSMRDMAMNFAGKPVRVLDHVSQLGHGLPLTALAICGSIV